MLLNNPDSFVAEWSHNKIFFSAFWAWFVAQFIKVALGVIRERRFNFKWFVGSGGMPSSHSAMVSALTTAIALYQGFDSGLFAAAFGFSMIIMFDAQGVRHQSGKQAEALNKILDDIYTQKGLQEEPLKELFGHTPMQVFAGAFLGVLIALLLYRI